MAEELEKPIDLSADDDVEKEVEELEIDLGPSIDETEQKEFDKKIKEVTLNLFAENGVASGFTEEINGFLECLIIESSDQIQIQITLEKYPDVVIFQHSNFHGQKYLSLRNKTIAPNGEMFNFQAAKWSLNDGLRVEINGSKGSHAHFVFKYS